MTRRFNWPQRAADDFRAHMAVDFPAYAWYVHGLNPAPFQKEWAQAMADPATRRLVVVAPPESGKTAWCIALCAWLIGKDPSVHIGYVGNTAAQAQRQSVAIRDTVRDNPRFREVFPDVLLDEGKGTAEREWFVRRDNPADKDASLLASGFRGPLLGARLDVVVLDDYSDQENTQTPEQQERAWEWLQQNVLTRLNPDRGRLVCIQTRWAEGDAAGRLEEVGARMLHFPALISPTAAHGASVPVRAERGAGAELVEVRTNVGQPPSSAPAASSVRAERGAGAELVEVRTNVGQSPSPAPAADALPPLTTDNRQLTTPDLVPLWPERWRREGLEARRREIGSRHFDLHYMGLITAREGTIFKPHWWSYWDATAAPGAGADALGVFPAQAGIQGGPSTHPHSPQPEPPPTPAALARAERRAAREAAQRESEGQRLQQEHDAVAATPAEGHGEHADAVANAGEPTDADSSFDRLRTNGDSAQEQDGAAPPAEGHGEHADAVASAGEPTDAGPSFDRLRTNGDSATPPAAASPITDPSITLSPHPLPTPTWIVLSVDTASKTGLTNDYSAATVWALCQLDWKRLPSAHSGPRSTHYLLHAWRDRLEYPDLLRTVEGMARQWRAQHIIIEDKGAGQALIPELRRRGLNAIPNNPTADKVTRAIGVTAVPEAGRVFLPRHAGWLEDFRYELETFPRARHDDWTDTVVQYLEWAAVHGDAFHGIWIL